MAVSPQLNSGGLFALTLPTCLGSAKSSCFSCEHTASSVPTTKVTKERDALMGVLKRVMSPIVGSGIKVWVRRWLASLSQPTAGQLPPSVSFSVRSKHFIR